MINIQEIYLQFHLDDPTPPHCFELENIAEMFIPEQKNNYTNIIHLLPLKENLSPLKIDSFLKASQTLKGHNTKTAIYLSHNNRGQQRFHILSSVAEDETQTAIILLQFFVEEMGAI